MTTQEKHVFSYDETVDLICDSIEALDQESLAELFEQVFGDTTCKWNAQDEQFEVTGNYPGSKDSED